MNEKPNQPQPPSSREKGNRTIGLIFYAGGIVLAGLLVFLAYDEIHKSGWAGFMASIKKDPTSFGIIAAGAVVSWAIGFTTGRRKPPKS